MNNIFGTQITFGDCDPAGIVFYPNTFRWMDAAFHNYLRPYGGHKKLCSKLQSVGIGLVDVSAQFHNPMRDGDKLSIDISNIEWGRRTIALTYEGRVGERIAFCGKEVRCLFIRPKTDIIAANMTELRKILGKDKCLTKKTKAMD